MVSVALPERVQERGRAGRHPQLTVEQILAWADAHLERTGRWPGVQSGEIREAPGRTWAAVNAALGRGSHGLPGGDSLVQVLARGAPTAGG
jgi:hypothetical protein